MPDSVLVEDDGPVLRAVVSLPGCSSSRALSAFTDPAVLARWWGGDLATDLTVGGAYVVRFPALGQTMTGAVVGYQLGRYLEFTWCWDGQDEPGRTVTVRVDQNGPATLSIEHGRYGEGEAEQAARAEHRAGWEHFLPRLPAAVLSE